MRTLGTTNSTPGWPNLHRAGPGGGKKHLKRGAKGPGVSLSCVHVLSVSLSLSVSLFLSLFSSCLLGRHTSMPRGCIFLYFLNKTEGAVTLSQSCWHAEGFNVHCFKFLLRPDRTEENTLAWQYQINVGFWNNNMLFCLSLSVKVSSQVKTDTIFSCFVYVCMVRTFKGLFS